MKHVITTEQTCCGCGSCKNVCPKNAIIMIPDDKGFLYPSIYNELCVECELCIKACPVNKEHIETLDRFPQKIYGLKAKDEAIREKSTSGGAFTLLANEILNKDGMVFGATLDENCQVRHIGVEKKADLDKLRGSKYVQSELGDTFTRILIELKKGRKVLFSGTPCQVDGLNSFLHIKGQSIDNLFTVDVLCHGVPSPKVWHDYVDYVSAKNRKQVVDFKFRTKLAGWENSIETIIFEDGKVSYNTHQSRLFMTLFYKNLSLRPMCFSCKYPSFKRCSDVTIGDFWGIDKIQPDLNDNKGHSVVLINTEKGLQLFGAVKEKAAVFVSDEKNCEQNALKRNAKAHEQSELFWSEYKEKGFEQIAEKYGKRSAISLLKIKLITILYKVGLLKFAKKFLGFGEK